MVLRSRKTAGFPNPALKHAITIPYHNNVTENAPSYLTDSKNYDSKDEIGGLFEGSLYNGLFGKNTNKHGMAKQGL